MRKFEAELKQECLNVMPFRPRGFVGVLPPAIEIIPKPGPNAICYLPMPAPFFGDVEGLQFMQLKSQPIFGL